MAVLDLDAKRAARSEAQRRPHEVTLGGEGFQLRPKMPLEALELMAEGKFRAAFGLLILEDNAGGALARFFGHVPDDSDLEDIVSDLYGQAQGESLASLASSANGGRPSKPTLPPAIG